MKKTLVLLTCALSLALTGCGASRPSAEELSKVISKRMAQYMPASAKGQSDKIVDCMAKGAVDSKMSSSSLRAMVDGKEKIDAGDARIFGEVTRTCATKAMKDATGQ